MIIHSNTNTHAQRCMMITLFYTQWDSKQRNIIKNTISNFFNAVFSLLMETNVKKITKHKAQLIYIILCKNDKYKTFINNRVYSKKVKIEAIRHYKPIIIHLWLKCAPT